MNLLGKGDIADIDLISIAARYTPHVIIDGPTIYAGEQHAIFAGDTHLCQRADHMISILGGYKALSSVYVSRKDQFHDVFPVLVDTAKRFIPKVLNEIREIPSTSSEVHNRKQRVFRAWESYAETLGYKGGNIGWSHSPQWVIMPYPPWETCGCQSCLCSERKPCHKLRVCKGCWKIFYCSAKCQKM